MVPETIVYLASTAILRIESGHEVLVYNSSFIYGVNRVLLNEKNTLAHYALRKYQYLYVEWLHIMNLEIDTRLDYVEDLK